MSRVPVVALSVRIPVEDWKPGLVVKVGAAVLPPPDTPERSTVNDLSKVPISVPSEASRTSVVPAGLYRM